MKSRVLLTLLIGVVVGISALAGISAVTVSAREPPTGISEEKSVPSSIRGGVAGPHAGTHSLTTIVRSDTGAPVEGELVTVTDKFTGETVFTGYTDSAGQINVTLPRGQYDVSVRNQEQSLNLNKDRTLEFGLSRDELPKA